MTDADTVLNSLYTFTTPDLTCTLQSTPGSGLGGPFDLETVTLHELGRWAVLGDHLQDTSAVMYGIYNACKRSPRPDDKSGMFVLYRGNPYH